MTTQIALDLRLARVKSGMTQRDVAHLLNINLSTLSRLEAGTREPTLDEIITCSLIFGRSFEDFFADKVENAKAALRDRISEMPDNTRDFVGTTHRDKSLERLERRLVTKPAENGDAA